MAPEPNAHPYYIVDVFAERKYAGNQLAVIPDADDLTGTEMQDIAREMHFSETTFVRSAAGSDRTFDFRIFTPEHEVPFAGHPTLGTAFVIREKIIQKPVDEIVLNCTAGKIPVAFSPGATGPEFLWMHQVPPEFYGTVDRGTMAEVLSIPEDSIDPWFPVEEVSTGLPFFIVPVTDRDAVKKAKINCKAYEALIATTRAKAIFFFCPEPYDRKNTFNARMFADALGIAEDPATGSACGCLAGYLARHRWSGNNPVDVRVEQGHEINRPSLLCCRAERHGDSIEVFVGGNVVMVAEGRLV
ncbi:MAG: PhzF family phenazine biosynthesis protein [Methanoregula sp.]|nr:PhzF family phenazine biosynthesis protein [Methanoregula sp.]